MTTSPEPNDSEAQLPDEQSPDTTEAPPAEQEPAPEPEAQQASAPEPETTDQALEQAAAELAISPAEAPSPPEATAPAVPEATDTPADADATTEPSPAAGAEPAQQAAEVLADDEVTGLPPAPADADATEAAPAEAETTETAPAEAEATEAAPAEAAPEATEAKGAPGGTPEAAAEGTGGKKRKRGKKGKGTGEGEKGEKAEQPTPKKKGNQPEPAEIVRRIGTTNERALAYVADPDPKLSRLSKKVQESLLPELPPVTAGALLGPAALARHLVASAAAGRYRDLFTLWELFRQHPAECKPVLAERSIALEKGQRAMRTSVILGLRGNAVRVAEDVRLAQGLIWQWLREILVEALPAIGARPAVASALLEREPDLDVPLPDNPTERWLMEAAAARQAGPLAPRVEQVLAEHVHRLPATVETLRLATLHFPARVEALVDRVDLDAPEIGAFLAWARDHGAAERLHGRIRERVGGTAARDRAEGLALWYSWQQRGVRLELPEALRADSLEGFDLSKPETAELAARLRSRGVELDLQGQLDALAGKNRQLAEKAYEAMVCANLDVQLPEALKDNPTVNEGTRCPNCQAWTWVRPGHEQRCPRPPAPAAEPKPDPFELAAAEVSGTDPQ